MSNIIMLGDENKEPEKQQEETTIEVKYDATEEDEERFFLMYHMSIQPSEAERLKPEYRRWLIGRFVAQKNMEQEAIERHKLMRQLAPNLKV